MTRGIWIISAVALGLFVAGAAAISLASPRGAAAEVVARWSERPQMVRSLAEWQGYLWAGTGRPSDGGAEIYRLGPDGLEKKASLPAWRLNSLLAGDDGLYVGAGTSNSGAAIFGRFNTHTEDGSGMLSDWTVLGTFSEHSFVYTLAPHAGGIALGLMKNNIKGGAEVWLYEDGALTKIGAPGFNGWPADDPAMGTYELRSFGGDLYASTFSDGLDSMVLRFDGTVWHVVPTPPTQIPLAFAEYDGFLVVAFQNGDSQFENPIHVLTENGFEPLGKAPTAWHRAFLPNHMASGLDGQLYVGFGGDLGTLQIWRFDGSWHLVNKWPSVAGEPATAEWFYRLHWFNGDLYAGLAANGGTNGSLWKVTASN